MTNEVNALVWRDAKYHYVTAKCLDPKARFIDIYNDLLYLHNTRSEEERAYYYRDMRPYWEHYEATVSQ